MCWYSELTFSQQRRLGDTGLILFWGGGPNSTHQPGWVPRQVERRKRSIDNCREACPGGSPMPDLTAYWIVSYTAMQGCRENTWRSWMQNKNTATPMKLLAWGRTAAKEQSWEMISHPSDSKYKWCAHPTGWVWPCPPLNLLLRDSGAVSWFFFFFKGKHTIKTCLFMNPER